MTDLDTAYAEKRALATKLAGAPGDIVQRVVAHHSIWLDSRGNHAFPLVALHGALWAYGFFELTGKLAQLIQYRYFLDAEERASRLAMLMSFAEGFKAVNREVFIDTFTNYYFTKEHGREKGADRFLRAELLDALNEMHAATAAERALDTDRARHVFVQALLFEQEVTVAPGIQREIVKLDCPILTALCKKPMVRFSYFPIWRRFYFRDFASKDERIDKAIRSFDIAQYRGWDEVERSMRSYELLPDPFFADPAAYLLALKQRIVVRGLA